MHLFNGPERTHFQHHALEYPVSQSPQSVAGLCFLRWKRFITYNIIHIHVCISYLTIPVISISLPCYLSWVRYVNRMCVVTKLSDEVYFISDGFISLSHLMHLSPITYLIHIYNIYIYDITSSFPSSLPLDFVAIYGFSIRTPSTFLTSWSNWQFTWTNHYFKPNTIDQMWIMIYLVIFHVVQCSKCTLCWEICDWRLISWAMQEVATVSSIRLSAPLSLYLVPYDGPL